jgi:hypothetical protein
MRTSLAHDDTFNSRFAARTGGTRPPENLEGFAVAAAVLANRAECRLTGAERRPRILQAASQHFPYGAMQTLDLRIRQSGGFPARVYSGIPQGLIDVNVPQTGNESLIQKQRFQNPLPCSEARGEFFGAESPVQRLRSQST